MEGFRSVLILSGMYNLGLERPQKPRADRNRLEKTFMAAHPGLERPQKPRGDREGE